MEYISKEQVFEQFKELLPWEKCEFLNMILDHLGENTAADYLFKNCGYTPFDFIDERDCINHYGTDGLLDEMYDSDIEDYIESHPLSISSYHLIEALKDRWIHGKTIYVTDSNLRELEKLVEDIKEYKKQSDK